MSEFDKWWEENYMSVSADRTEAEDIYSIGVESQQAKIDLLEVQLKGAEERVKLTLDHKNKMVDELQARVDRVVHILTYTNHASTPLCNELRDILKGNKDEN